MNTYVCRIWDQEKEDVVTEILEAFCRIDALEVILDCGYSEENVIEICTMYN